MIFRFCIALGSVWCGLMIGLVQVMHEKADRLADPRALDAFLEMNFAYWVGATFAVVAGFFFGNMKD